MLPGTNLPACGDSARYGSLTGLRPRAHSARQSTDLDLVYIRFSRKISAAPVPSGFPIQLLENSMNREASGTHGDQPLLITFTKPDRIPNTFHPGTKISRDRFSFFEGSRNYLFVLRKSTLGQKLERELLGNLARTLVEFLSEFR